MIQIEIKYRFKKENKFAVSKQSAEMWLGRSLHKLPNSVRKITFIDLENNEILKSYIFS